MSDNLTPAQRSLCMSRVRSKNSSLELAVKKELRKCGLKFRSHVSNLPGCPDFVFKEKKLAVFVDGDFWHGYRFPTWSKKLKPFWRDKISRNIARDKRNFSKLRRGGWTVVRIWGHSVKSDLDGSILRIKRALKQK